MVLIARKNATLKQIAMDDLAQLRPMIGSPQVASIIWRRHLHSTEREQLGRDETQAIEKYNAVDMLLMCRRMSRHHAEVFVAMKAGFISETRAMNLLSDIGETLFVEWAVDESVRTQVLVVIEVERQVFLNSNQCPIHWNRSMVAWPLFWTMAINSSHGDSTSPGEFYDGESMPQLKHQIHALKNLSGFPKELAELIKPVKSSPGEYQIEINKDLIAIFPKEPAQVRF